MTPKTALRHAWRLAPAGGYVVGALFGASEARLEQPYRDEATVAETAGHEDEGERGEVDAESASPAQAAAGATAALPSSFIPDNDLPPRAPARRLRPDNPDPLPPLRPFRGPAGATGPAT